MHPHHDSGHKKPTSELLTSSNQDPLVHRVYDLPASALNTPRKLDEVAHSLKDRLLRKDSFYDMPEMHEGMRILDLTQASALTRISANDLQEFMTFSNNFFLVSMRIQNPAEHSNRNINYKPSPKTTSISGKTEPYISPSMGNIPLESKYAAKEGKPVDNKFPATFPAGAKSFNNEAMGKHIEQYFFKEGYPVKQIKITKDGLICFSADVKIERLNPDQTITMIPKIKHYIQANKNMRLILLQFVTNPQYKLTKIENGLIYFTVELKGIKTEKCIDLTRLLPPLDNKLINEQIKNAHTLDGIIRIFLDKEELLIKNVPMFNIEEVAGEKVKIPFMVQANTDGYAIGSDIDQQNIARLPFLPDEAHVSFFSKTMTAEEIYAKIKKLKDAMHMLSWETYQKEYLQSPELSVDDIEHIKAMYQKFEEGLNIVIKTYKDADEMSKLNFMGGNTVYDLVMQHAFNQDKKNSIIYWLHGAECAHPMEVPEKFEGILSLWKGRYIATSDEESYLKFLLHDRDILKFPKIGVHPYWLQASGTGKKADPDHSKDWLDIIEIQALNIYNLFHDSKNACKYLEKVIIEINGIPRNNNAQAVEKIKNLIANIEKTPKHEVADKIDKFYAQFEAKYSVCFEKFKVRDSNDKNRL